MSSYVDINAGHGEVYANKLSVDTRGKLVYPSPQPSPQPSPAGGEGVENTVSVWVKSYPQLTDKTTKPQLSP